MVACAKGPLRQLWFCGSGVANLQTEIVLDGARVDIERSLSRTPYLRFMAKRMMGDASSKHFLFLGLGGGLLPMVALAHGAARVVVIEQSASVVHLAHAHFCLPKGIPRLEVICADAAEAVFNSDLAKFNVVALD
eukprot:5229699-Amphidinium_carterae.1